MAKHCDVCNKSYPETEAHCPHCAAAGGEPLLAESESAVNLGAELSGSGSTALEPYDPASGESAVGWSELVADADSHKGPPSSAKIDSPSDRDLLDATGESAGGGEPFVAEIASAVDLPGAGVFEVPPRVEGPVVTSTSESAVGGQPFVAEIASDEDLTGASSSAIDLGGKPRRKSPSDSAVLAEVAEDDGSAVNLGSAAGRPADESDVAAAELAEESAVHLGSDPDIPPEGSGFQPDVGQMATEPDLSAGPGEHVATTAAEPEGDTHFLDDIAEVEAGSAVDLGEATRSTDRSSSRDLIAEAVESGVDVAGKSKDEGEAEVGGSAVDLGAAAAEGSHSSAPEAVPERRVPPGSHHDIDLDAAAAEEPAGTGPGSSGVDLGGAAGRPPKKRPLAGSSSNLDLDAAAAAALAEEEERPAKAKGRKAADEEDEEQEAAPARARKAADDEEEDEAPSGAPRRAAAADEDEDEDKPAPKKQPKARSGVGCALVGTFLGLLLGVGTAFGLWMFGIEPPKDMRLAGGPSTTPERKTNPDEKKTPPGGGTAVDAGDHLKHGEFGKAVEGLSGDGDEVKAQRGTARWMQYLQDQMAKGEKPDANAPAVKTAREELEAAAQKDNPEAILALGNLQEHTGAATDAKKTYQDGLQKFAAKPAWARVFQAQIDRLDTERAVDLSKPGAAAPRTDEDRHAAARALAALLIAFQAGQPSGEQGGDKDKGPEEAGFDFWTALKAAQAGKYADAVKQLETARKLHEKLRFSRLRKAQNPLSDPTEDIFLRCAEEIEAYWTLQNYLTQQGVAGREPQKAVERLVKERNDAVAQLKGIADKLKVMPERAALEIDALVKARDDAAKKATMFEVELIAAKKDLDTAKKDAKDLGDKLTTADKDRKAAEAKLKAVGDRLAAAGVKDADPGKGIDTLVAERAAADKTLNTVVERIALANVRVDRKDVLKGVDRVVETALVNDPKGELMASRDEIRRLGTVLAERRTPEQMLDIWLPILADRGRKDEAPKATADAELVRKDDRATAVGKKKALAVLGLARRDLGDYEQARTLLADAVAGPGPKADWQAPVAQALKELTDPAAYYLPRARALYEDSKYKEAMDTIIEARKLFPKEAAELLALDSLIQLDIARDKGNGKIDPASPAVTEAKASAEKAAAAGNANGHYALGRINEELGNLAEAKASYAKALAAHGDSDEAGIRYRLALARVLKLQALKAAGGRAAAPVRGLPVAGVDRPSLTTLLLMLEIGLQPAAGADPDEAGKLLDEVTNAKDGPDTFMFKAQALALRGLWTPALKTYVAGLRPHIRRDYADGLAELVDRHPALRRPNSMEPPNPLLAEASYSSGLRHYFARRYADAETAFVKAIEQDNQDARYFYFLGLSRLGLNRAADAEADFHDGAQLEQQSRPGREAVSTALERVQGPARQTVNRFRP
jgi:hypothetical protein